MARNRRRVSPAALKSGLTARRPRSRLWKLLVLIGVVAFFFFEIERVVTAPIVGRAAWDHGVLIGSVAGVLGAVAWWLLLRRPSTVTRALAGAATLGWLGLVLTSTGGRGAPTPAVNTEYLTVAATYAAFGLAGVVVLLTRGHRFWL